MIESFKKVWAWVRWFLIVIPLGVLKMVTAPLLYPLADLMKSWRFNVLWVYLDDSAYNEDGSFYKDYRLWLINNGGLKETFIQRYRWHAFRNSMWNLVEIIKPKEGKEIVYDMKINGLMLKDEPLLIDNDSEHPYMAALKYVDRFGNSGWNVNGGKYISYNHTIHGTSYFYYKIGNRVYFRYSQVKIVKFLFFWKRYRTIKLGTNKHRFVLTLKYSKLKDWIKL